MSDDVGLWQYARGAEPDHQFGYCTDDVARAIVVDVLHTREDASAALDVSLRRSLRFVGDAFDSASGRFRNLRTADGRWLEEDASEDCHARALVGLAAVMAEMPGTELADRARNLFVRALPATVLFGAMRAVSAALLACDSAIASGVPTGAEPAFELLAANLAHTFGNPAVEQVPGAFRPDTGPAASLEWLWPEPMLTYENALMPRALIAAGLRLGRPALLAQGCAVLDWLLDVQAGESGQFSPIGNTRWWVRGGERSRFDQQPIEAGVMVSAAADAFRATGRRRYLEAAEAAYGWFLGDNDVGVALADPVRGACFDGLSPMGPSANQGAESTLMWLTALEQMRELRRSTESDLRSGFAAEPLVESESRIGPDA